MAFEFRHKESFSTVLIKYFSFKNETKSFEPLTEILRSVRKINFQEVLAFLHENEEITENFSYYLKNLFDGKPFNLSLTEANILSENAFYPELKKRILDKLLPNVENEDTVWYLVDSVSVRPKADLEFFKSLDQDSFSELFRLLKIDELSLKKSVKRELLFSLNILSWRIIGNALDVQVVNMAPEYRDFDNPFVALQNEIDLLNESYKEDPDFFLTSKSVNYKQIRIYMKQCFDFVSLAFKNSSKYGISGKINQALLKTRQQLQRMSDILSMMVFDSEEDVIKNSKKLIFKILEYKSHKNNLRELILDSTTLKSHLITNHTAETGTHYITSSRKEYLKLLWKASAGGIIIGACSILKILYSDLPSSEFGHAVIYSLNYAMCFVVIYLMGYTIATKQPAMTAATMAKVLSDGKNTKKNYVDFAHFVSKLFRSQFIAFVGNVLVTFATALAVIYGLDVLFNYNYGYEKADMLFHNINMFESKALLHASIAGVFLFFSGIISGNVGNSSVFYQIPKRIAKNPLLNYFLGERVSRNLSEYYARNCSGIVSNFWFGVFLGVTGPVGKFLGLDIDIRHITFSTGNFAAALYGKDFKIDYYTFWISLVTVGLIGFFNFAVSFALSMILAFRSRQINSDELKEIYREIVRYFMKNPFRFFLPISSTLDGRGRKMVENMVVTKPEDR
ncbi:Site-specific recombinase [Kaistella treverensis]|uniref:Site-specific recombinase n=1 Tax=Kaistella treverensis TaxID=631455 RepID=A0A1I3K6H5_9FLAO|nr:recombinase [Kaistella treverensis]SFI67900.1 Site-specific recombinase [Kaistella treverensis]